MVKENLTKPMLNVKLSTFPFLFSLCLYVCVLFVYGDVRMAIGLPVLTSYCWLLYVI
jgi:hypothetical protein